MTSTTFTDEAVQRLKSRLGRKKTERRRLVETAERSDNGDMLTEEQDLKFRTLSDDIEAIEDRIEQLQEDEQRTAVTNAALARVGGGRGSASEYRVGAPLGQEQRMVDYVQSRGLVPDEHRELSLGKCLRGHVLGDWQGADLERRAMAEGVVGTGGAMLPAPLSAQVIDRARNEAAVFRAGARTVPMESATLTLPRWVTDPTAAWHSENVAIAQSDPTMEAVQLKAQTLAGLVTLSRELLEDTNVDAELVRIFGEVFALKIDAACLYGTGTAPEPRGIRNTSGINTVSMGTNGAALTNYDPLVDAVGTLADNNHRATAAVFSPRSARVLGKLKDTTNQPLQPPEILSDLRRYMTGQVLNTQTQGTAVGTASDIFVGDWSELLVGIRTSFSIQVLNERYADTGSIGLWHGSEATSSSPDRRRSRL